MFILHVNLNEPVLRGVNAYMNPNLLDGQFETQEEPKHGLAIDASLPVDAILHKIRTALKI